LRSQRRHRLGADGFDEHHVGVDALGGGVIEVRHARHVFVVLVVCHLDMDTLRVSGYLGNG
jgi:hypothetical protein